ELLLLALLQGDLLAGEAHALALVGFRRTNRADLGAHLAELLDVDALDRDFRLARALHRDAVRDREIHRVREAEREVQRLALHGGAIADAHELELLLVALGHAFDHVRQVRARGAGGHAAAFAVVLDLQLLVLLLDGDATGHDERQLALGAFDLDRVRRHGGADALWEVDGSFCNSAHSSSLVRPRCRALRRPARW